MRAAVRPRDVQRSDWLVESQSAWIAPSSKLEILVPVNENAKFLFLEFQVLAGSCIDFDVMLEQPADESAVRLYGHRSGDVPLFVCTRCGCTAAAPAMYPFSCARAVAVWRQLWRLGPILGDIGSQLGGLKPAKH